MGRRLRGGRSRDGPRPAQGGRPRFGEAWPGPFARHICGCGPGRGGRISCVAGGIAAQGGPATVGFHR
eukprot:3368857-Lingulodinium_polyedra.AAC.1